MMAHFFHIAEHVTPHVGRMYSLDRGFANTRHFALHSYGGLSVCIIRAALQIIYLPICDLFQQFDRLTRFCSIGKKKSDPRSLPRRPFLPGNGGIGGHQFFRA
jgi:hypothetical protein